MRIKIKKENLNRAYEHFESALILLKDLKIKDFISRFYYGLIWFLNGIFDNLKGELHKRERYKEIFRSDEHQILGEIWEDFKALRIVADYGYYQGKSWDDYEEKFWKDIPEKIEKFSDYLKTFEKEVLEVILIKEKVEEIKVWLILISNVKK